MLLFLCVQTLQHRPDSSVMPKGKASGFAGLGIVANSGTVRDDEAIDRSLLKKLFNRQFNHFLKNGAPSFPTISFRQAAVVPNGNE